jgi:hypothetical protein
MKKIYYILMLLVITTRFGFAQSDEFTAVSSKVDFTNKLQLWDGFGFNYVETAHTYDYDQFPQEYGGFSLLSDKQKQEIIDMVFGEDGLKVALMKMFLCANHQKEPYGPYDHETTTSNMRHFVREGLKVTRSRGADLQIITTLFGPPGFMTVQKANRGRDLDPDLKTELANYMIDWAKFLKENERFPIKYISLHNEGEDWHRWNQLGFTDWDGHDYNLFWSPEMVVEYINMMPKMLKKAGLADVGVTPGEPTNWYRFSAWGYAEALAKDKKAPKNMGLITSHGFYHGGFGRWFGEHNAITNDLLRSKNPKLHSWVTSTSWSNMDARFIKEMHGNIYTAKVNGIIPWAGIQRPTHWPKNDPNPGCAFLVREDGTYEVTKGYYYYKQLTRAGQPGTAIAHTSAMDSEVAIIAFAKNGSKNPDAIVITNHSNKEKKISLEIIGSNSTIFSEYRTQYEGTAPIEQYSSICDHQIVSGKVVFSVPAGSVTTLFGK